MSDASGRFTRLWEAVRRRKVFRAGVIYTIAAWTVVQAASIAFPVFGVPDWVMRAVLVASFAGFPIAIVLAWVFDLTSHGIEVTAGEGAPRGTRRPPKWWVRPLVAAPLLALIVGGTAWLWTSRFAGSGETEFTRQARPDDLPIVAVLPLENLTGRKDLDWAGAGIANLVRDELAQSRFLAVVSTARTLRMTGEPKDLDRLFTAAAESGITHVLTGEILRTPKGLTITSRLTDLRRNVESGANRQEALAEDEVLGVAPSVASLVKQSLGVPGTEKVDVFAADFATRNVAAYEAYIVGLQHFLQFDYASAQQLFRTAVDKAPDFAMAHYRLAHTMVALGDTAGAMEQIEAAQADAARLSARERRYIAAGASYFARDYAAAERQYRDIVEDLPYETEARVLLLYVLHDQDRYEEALEQAEVLTAQDPGDEVASSTVADLNIKLGRYDEAAQSLQKFLQLSPDNPNAHYLVGERHFLQGQFAEAASAYRRALELDPSFADAALRLPRIELLEGRSGTALAQLLTATVAPSFSASQHISAALDASHLLRAEGRCAEAEQLLAALAGEIVAERVSQAYVLSVRALCRLDAGDVGGAESLADEALAKAPGRLTRYLFVRGLAAIERGDSASVAATIAAIRALKPPQGAGDGTEARTADYLEGLRLLEGGNASGALAPLQAATDGAGEQYALYGVALARAREATGDRRGARALLRKLLEPTPPAELMLSLEPGRREAERLLASLGG
jgi:tetratricopeptide (TPR) repeat protein